ncbi:M56 family metallopeptidase [Planctomycetota bacterium]
MFAIPEFSSVVGNQTSLAVALLQLMTAATSILLLACILVSLLKNQSAALRHRTWALSVAALLFLPLLLAVLPNYGPNLRTVPVVVPGAGSTATTGNLNLDAIDYPSQRTGKPIDSIESSVKSNAKVQALVAGHAKPVEPSVRISESRESTSVIRPANDQPVSPPENKRFVSIGKVSVAVWFVGVFLGIVLLIRSRFAVARVLRNSVEVTHKETLALSERMHAVAGVARPARLYCSSEVVVPLTVGCVRPVVLLPSGYAKWSAERCRVVLAHELAHIRRRDVLLQLVAHIACCFYWWHPLVWLANGRMRIEREFACDDAVLEMGEVPDKYAGHLVDVAASIAARINASQTPSCAVAMAGPGSLENRVRAILRPYLKRNPVNRRTNQLLWVGTIAVAVATSLLTPSNSQEAANGSPQARGDTEVSAAEEGTSANEVTSGNQEPAESAVVDTNDEMVAVRGLVVDSKQTPVADAEVRTDGDGIFTIEIAADDAKGAVVIAKAGDRLMGSSHLGYEPDSVADQRITLQPARVLDVTVVNRDGDHVEGVTLFAKSHFAPITEKKTNASGKAALAVPTDLPLQFVLADAGKRGIDYVLFRQKDAPKSSPYPLPHDHRGPIELTLSPTRSLTVKALDQDGKPIANARVYPWYYQLPNKGGMANLGSIAMTRTNRDGLAVIDNLPAENEHPITIWVSKEGYEPEDRFTFDPKSTDQGLTTTLHSHVVVSGRVTQQDGIPAAGIPVFAAGYGHGFDGSYRTETVTNADGSFQMDVARNKYYLFVAKSNKRASPIAQRTVLEESISDIDLKLQEAIRIHGQVTEETTGNPTADEYVQLYQQEMGRGYLDPDYEPRLPNPKNDRSAIAPRIVVNEQTDSDGRFEFYVGPGKYYMFGPRDAKRDIFELTDQNSFEVRMQAKPKLEGSLKGRVVLKSDPDKSFSEATIYGEWNPPIATSDEHGYFETRRPKNEQYYSAFVNEDELGAIVRAPAGAESITLALEPTATLTGSLFSEESEQPAADRKIIASIQINHEGGTFSHTCERHDNTDNDGRFTISGIVPGHMYTFRVVVDRDADGSPRSWRQVGEFTASESATMNVGQLRLPSSPRQLTTEDRIDRLFTGQDDLANRLTQRLADAELSYQQVLLVVGEQESELVKEFVEARRDYRKSNLSFREALANFIRIGVASEQTDFLKQQGVKRPKSGSINFAILDSYGRLIVEANSEQLTTDDGKLDRQRFTEFLKTRRLPLPDAGKELSNALEQAKRENRRVLVQVSGPGCAPCVLLSRFLESQKQLVSKEYVYVKLDSRMPNGDKVIRKLRLGTDHGIPWTVILSSDGDKLITSDLDPDSESDKRNIGFPSSEEGRKHFEKMLRSTARNLSSDEILTIIQPLRK